MRKLSIAIAGAGPAGLATALYLRRLGHDVHIFERFETPGPVGSGLMIQPVGEAVLRDLGLWEKLSALGQRLVRLDGRDARSGQRVLDVSYASLGEAAALGVHRAALFGVLYDAVRAAGMEVKTGCLADDWRVEAEGGMLSCGPDVAHGPFDLLVDALGAGSPLKARSAGSGRARALSYGALFATLDWCEGFDEGALSQRYDGASVMIGVLPIGQRPGETVQKAAFFWSCRHADYPGLQAEGIESLKGRVRHYWPAAAPLVDQITDFNQLTLARYHHATMQAPFGDRIVFVGDSAHSTSPQLGQGANMALLDARALYVAMRDADDLPAAQKRYAASRRFHVRLYQALSWTLTPFYQSDSRILPVLRDLVVAAPARLPPAQWVLAQLVAGQIGRPLKALGLN